MTAERLKETTKERWKKCQQLSEKLGVHKTKVHQYLWTTINEKGWYDAIVAGDESVIAELKASEGWARMTTPEPRIHNPDDGEELDEAGQLRIGLWFIKKVGGSDNARKIIAAASSALDKLRGT